MLLTTYPEIIDVGRAERGADLALLTQMAMYNEKFGDFELRLVQASRFEPVEREEEWRQLTKWVRDGLTFYGRSHDVHVERFLPKGTPVVITDTNVDSEMVDQMRRQLEQGVAVNPNAHGVVSRMLQVLDDLGSPGGVLTIHINADNPLIDRLRSATHRDAARLGMMSVCWRAVLDYFGWNSDRDMLNRDKQFTQELITGLLEITEERDETDARARALRQELEQLKESLDWGAEGRREAIICVLDIEDSVARIVANPGGGPDDAFAYLQLVLADVREYIEGFARVIGLTGDGMQFVIEPGGRGGGANVRAALTTGLAARLQTVSDRNGKIRELRERASYRVPRFRAALAAGPVYISKMSPSHADVLGLPAVHASRLCAQKSLYNDADASLLLTQQAINTGPVWGLWQAEDFAPAGEATLVGIAAPIPIYKPSPR